MLLVVYMQCSNISMTWWHWENTRAMCFGFRVGFDCELEKLIKQVKINKWIFLNFRKNLLMSHILAQERVPNVSFYFNLENEEEWTDLEPIDVNSFSNKPPLTFLFYYSYIIFLAFPRLSLLFSFLRTILQCLSFMQIITNTGQTFQAMFCIFHGVSKNIMSFMLFITTYEFF